MTTFKIWLAILIITGIIGSILMYKMERSIAITIGYLIYVAFIIIIFSLYVLTTIS